jgi:hypothetical protein
MATYILRSEKEVCTVKLVGNYDADRVLAIVQANEPDANWTECEKRPKGKHACKYCGSITDGTHEDVYFTAIAEKHSDTRFLASFRRSRT